MADIDLPALTATEAAAALAAGTITSEEVVAACLARIEEREPEVGAFVHFDPEQVLAEAKAQDEEQRQGRPLGSLHGLQVAVKDIIDTADMPTENGTPLDAGRRPEHDATIVARLKDAGAIILGKTVTTELGAMHPRGTRNPHNAAHTPGGSSSGSGRRRRRRHGARRAGQEGDGRDPSSAPAPSTPASGFERDLEPFLPGPGALTPRRTRSTPVRRYGPLGGRSGAFSPD